MDRSSATEPAAEAAVPTWDEIVERHSDRVFRLAYRLTGNRHDAEDLTQEVFVRVFRSLDTYTPGTFEGWLHRITTNLFLDGARRKQRIRFDGLSDERADRLTSQSPSPDAAYAEQRFDDDIERALATLPPDFRAAVVLCDVEGPGLREIAEILGAKLGTVRSRIHRGRTMLRTALAHRAPADGPRALLRSADGARCRWCPARGGHPMIGPIGHLGHRVSDLLDGQMSPDDEERAWAHVHGCHTCRDLVEREGWVKTRLAGLAGHAAAPSTLGNTLKGSLLDVSSMHAGALRLTPGEAFLVAHEGPRPRRSGLVALGGGAAGAAVMGVLALGGRSRAGPDALAPAPGRGRDQPVPDDPGAAPTTPRHALRPPGVVRRGTITT